jgi:hypothetical protein
MSPIDDLERGIANYYDSVAPSRAPDWLLVQALGRVDTTPQRRTRSGLPWRLPPMPSLAKFVFGSAALLVVTVIGMAVLRPPAGRPAAPASPGPSSSPSVPQPPELSERFDSTLNGISMSYPAGWQTRSATEPWTDGLVTFDSTGVDIIFDRQLGEDLYFAMASEPLDGRPDDAWRASVHGPPGGLCEERGGHGGSYTRIDGASGWIAVCGGEHSLLVATDTRGFAIFLHIKDRALAETYDFDWFSSVIETVDLRHTE